MNYIYQDYRKRFGIETSYRLKKRMRPTWSQTPGRTRTKPVCRIRTTTKNPILRLLYVGISFLLVNIWIYILWSKISKPRRGGRARLSLFVYFKTDASLFSQSSKSNL